MPENDTAIHKWVIVVSFYTHLNGIAVLNPKGKWWEIIGTLISLLLFPNGVHIVKHTESKTIPMSRIVAHLTSSKYTVNDEVPGTLHRKLIGIRLVGT